MYILNNKLDKYQEEIVKLDYQNLLVIAGAGSGKTFTILAKIKYLVTVKKIDEKDIITITFTNNSNENLKQKLNKEGLFNVRSYTFHKLAIEILNEDLKISDDELLFDVINKFFYIDVLEDNNMMRLILNYFGTYIIPNIKNTYNKFIQTNEKEINYLMRQIKSFINRYKTNNYTLEDFNIFLNKIKTITNIINY